MFDPEQLPTLRGFDNADVATNGQPTGDDRSEKARRIVAKSEGAESGGGSSVTRRGALAATAVALAGCSEVLGRGDDENEPSTTDYGYGGEPTDAAPETSTPAETEAITTPSPTPVPVTSTDSTRTSTTPTETPTETPASTPTPTETPTETDDTSPAGGGGGGSGGGGSSSTPTPTPASTPTPSPTPTPTGTSGEYGYQAYGEYGYGGAEIGA